MVVFILDLPIHHNVVADVLDTWNVSYHCLDLVPDNWRGGCINLEAQSLVLVKSKMCQEGSDLST